MTTVRASICTFVQNHPNCTIDDIADGMNRGWGPTRQACATLGKDGYLTATEYSRGGQDAVREKKRFTCSSEQIAKLFAAEERLSRQRQDTMDARYDSAPDLANVMHAFVRPQQSY